MKYIVTILITFSFFSVHIANAYTFNGYDSKYITVKNIRNQSHLYAKLYNNKEVLIYTVSPIFPADFIFGADSSRDILLIDFSCNSKKAEPLCNIAFNRSTGEHAFYDNYLSLHSIKKVVFLYNKENSLVIIKPLFKPCLKPLTYKVMLAKYSDFGIESGFLTNGDLKLFYTPFGSDQHTTKTFHINYPKLFADCKGEK